MDYARRHALEAGIAPESAFIASRAIISSRAISASRAISVLRIVAALCAIASIALPVSSCAGREPDLAILASSESAALEPVIKEFAKRERSRIETDYRGSIEIMLELSSEAPSYDVVWPAHSLWIQLGDAKKRVKGSETIMSGPVVFGVRSSLAEKFGWKGKPVLVRDILARVRSGELSFMMASASQSNSGAGAYLGALYALAGNPVVLSSKNLADPRVRSDVTAVLAGVDRSSGTSRWLTELFLKSDADCMVNYESSIIEANLALEKSGRETLYAVYPADGMSVADYPLGFIERKPGSRREALFDKLKAYLKSAEGIARIEASGRRAGLGGVALNPDPAIFRAEWGIDPRRSVSSVPLPPRDVILEALNLYQTEFRRPSATAYVLDFSGSMYGKGEDALKDAIGLVLDPERSSRVLLQAGPRDYCAIIAFSDRVLKTWETYGNDPEELRAVLGEIESFTPSGGTDIHGPVLPVLEALKDPGFDGYGKAVILMTDGADNAPPDFDALEEAWKDAGSSIPVFCITFGAADERDLKKIADLTRARVFDGRSDLAGSFRTAK